MNYRPLSILFWFRRRPYGRGGDLVALEWTIDALREFNVTATISDDPTHDLAPYDIVHLYNLCDPYSATDYILRAARAHKPTVATPIYWSHAQYLAAYENESPATYPELFLDAPAPQDQARLRASRRENAELVHDVQQLVFDAVGKVLVLSNGEGEIIQKEFGISREKVQLTRYGVNPQYQRGDAARFEREFGVHDFVLCAARFEHRKNQIGIIRALREENIPLVLAGPAPEPRYLELCKREASSNVHFVGELTPAQIADAGAAARVHVMASWWEEMGQAALEAGLAGCNLVMTQNGPGREYFGDDCFVCDPADVNSIRIAIQRAWERPRTTQLAEKIRAQYTWEQSAAATRDAYDEILAAKHVPTISPDALSRVTIRFAEHYHHIEREHLKLIAGKQELEAWALEMQARLAQPSLRAALRGVLDSAQGKRA